MFGFVERTKNMLFNGVQSLYSSETVTADANCNLPFIANYNTVDNASQVPGQLVIDHEGQLTVPSALNKANSEEMETGNPTPFGLSSNSSSFDFSKGRRKKWSNVFTHQNTCYFK